ncbi:pyridoxal-phosphate dependent enzyme [soil metagenome]
MEENLNFDMPGSPVQLIHTFSPSNISLYIKREDLLHSFISGNKFRKLKYNLHEAGNRGHHTLLTFGGAFSNHIAAVAAAGKLQGFHTLGVIRGKELEEVFYNGSLNNPTLDYASGQGMKFKFISREAYRLKNTEQFREDLKREFGSFYMLPEGGTNALAIKGCEEILTGEDEQFDIICCAVGTGGTITGLINSAFSTQTVLGFPALKGDFLTKEISNFSSRRNWRLINDYHFGGYGKVSRELIDFINDFYEKYHIPLDPVYTGKMFFGIFDLIERSAFPQNSRILAIHTGGLQGVEGMNLKLAAKNLPLINVLYEK